MVEENLKLVPLLFVGYIDPSAGQVFSSIGPVLLSAIGGALGVGAMFLAKIRNRILELLRKDKDEKDQEVSGAGD